MTWSPQSLAWPISSVRAVHGVLNGAQAWPLWSVESPEKGRGSLETCQQGWGLPSGATIGQMVPRSLSRGSGKACPSLAPTAETETNARAGQRWVFEGQAWAGLLSTGCPGPPETLCQAASFCPSGPPPRPKDLICCFLKSWGLNLPNQIQDRPLECTTPLPAPGTLPLTS